MKKDRDRELERLEKELLADDDLLEDLPEALLKDGREEPAPAFEDPDWINEPQEPMVYCNFSNDYGRKTKNTPPQKEMQTKKGKSAAAKKQGDKVQIILMAVISFLCLGMIGVVIYWLEVLLK